MLLNRGPAINFGHSHDIENKRQQPSRPSRRPKGLSAGPTKPRAMASVGSSKGFKSGKPRARRALGDITNRKNSRQGGGKGNNLMMKKPSQKLFITPAPSPSFSPLIPVDNVPIDEVEFAHGIFSDHEIPYDGGFQLGAVKAAFAEPVSLRNTPPSSPLSFKSFGDATLDAKLKSLGNVEGEELNGLDLDCSDLDISLGGDVEFDLDMSFN